MDSQKHRSKSLSNIENTMQELDENSMRYHVLKSAKDFKTSWIELGQTLYSVWKDKLYKEWGFSTFDAYTAKEIGIKKDTAFKLLRSYYFLEKEEPALISRDYTKDADTATLPTYEAVNTLRLAKNNKNIDQEDYSKLKKYVIEKGQDARDVKKDLTQMIKQRQELDPEESREKRKVSLLKRLIGVLRSVQTEIKTGKLLPAQIVKEADSLISKLEDEIPANYKD